MSKRLMQRKRYRGSEREKIAREVSERGGGRVMIESTPTRVDIN